MAVCEERGFHIMAKPVGPICNLNCEYCFYLEKKALFGGARLDDFRMSDRVLEHYIRKYIGSQSIPIISFVWQGGEPLLAGLGFYRKAVALQKKYADGKTICNSIQTNATLLDDRWCEFLKEHNFLVGVSIDGPQSCHDRYRKDTGGKGSFDRAMRGLSLLQKHGVDYNVLVCVAKETSQNPLETYRFFRNHGVRYLQFTPVVERLPDKEAARLRLHNAAPHADGAAVTEWTVDPAAYGAYLIAIFDEWVHHDVGSMFVMNFEWALAAWLGLESSACIFSEQCGGCAIVEHNGDVYACDHYMYPAYRIANILQQVPGHFMHSPQQLKFGAQKRALPVHCQSCEVLFACRGECPRHRFAAFAPGESGRSYLCEGYRAFFRHIHPYMKGMCQLLENGLPVTDIMTLQKHPIAVIQTGSAQK